MLNKYHFLEQDAPLSLFSKKKIITLDIEDAINLLRLDEKNLLIPEKYIIAVLTTAVSTKKSQYYRPNTDHNFPKYRPKF